jgi:hypothetical protein
MSAVAYSDRSGVIGITNGRMPKGMLPIIRMDNEFALRELISATCRHSYDGITLLVPGIPEAGDDADAALDALMKFRDFVKK